MISRTPCPFLPDVSARHLLDIREIKHIPRNYGVISSAARAKACMFSTGVNRGTAQALPRT